MNKKTMMEKEEQNEEVEDDNFDRWDGEISIFN